MLPENNQEQQTMPEIPVNGKVLKWARKERNLDIGGAASLLGITDAQLSAYEEGEKKPLLTFLRLMAHKYRINFASLLMPEPLPPAERPKDFRRRHGDKPLSIDTIVAFQEINDHLDAFEDLKGGRGGIVAKLRLGKANLKEKPEVVASRARKSFGVTIKEQQSWDGLGGARLKWRKKVEGRGIFTYMIDLPEDVSGFSIIRNNLAAICINDRESNEGAKIFTLFHEYCHLLLRQGGISDQNEQDSIERFCNEFAGCFLIPRKPLIETIEVFCEKFEIPYEFSDEEIKKLATRFRVSNRALAYRLEKYGLARPGFYAERTRPWDISKPKPAQQNSHPNPITVRKKQIGDLHADTVMKALRKHAINPSDASDLIGFRASVLHKFEAALG